MFFLRAGTRLRKKRHVVMALHVPPLRALQHDPNIIKLFDTDVMLAMEGRA